MILPRVSLSSGVTLIIVGVLTMNAVELLANEGVGNPREAREITVHFAGGVTLKGDYSSDAGFAARAEIGVPITDRLKAEVSIAYHRIGDIALSQLAGVLFQPYKQEVRIFPITVGFLCLLSPQDALSPYVCAGAGTYLLRRVDLYSNAEQLPDWPHAWRGRPGGNVGVGLLASAGRVGIRIEGRYHFRSMQQYELRDGSRFGAVMMGVEWAP